MASGAVLFQDIFDVKDLNPQGKRFDRVSRLIGHSENYEMDLTLDFNSEIYPLNVGEKFSLVLASSLSLDANKSSTSGVEKKESWRERAPGERDLSDEYEYVMYGKVYRYEDSNKGAGQQVAVYISYGGLLMCVEGDYRHLQNLTVGENVYLLIRK
ncbi:RNA polymerase [Mycotypha africana]|uniref:RNA polymerase n=1 Tax=Mycotypha africana TaxID=64632 RepID=UPI00230062EF|nr:RNA polymerase [Mycotypha africana]KAI8971428.1 RNA polymerase [Mycotypha africana]